MAPEFDGMKIVVAGGAAGIGAANVEALMARALRWPVLTA